MQFAQSPQALVFDDFVRIYFSTRAMDTTNGKYLSHVAFVDMDKNLRDVIRVSERDGASRSASSAASTSTASSR